MDPILRHGINMLYANMLVCYFVRLHAFLSKKYALKSIHANFLISMYAMYMHGKCTHAYITSWGAVLHIRVGEWLATDYCQIQAERGEV
jgi:hypothetical protein